MSVCIIKSIIITGRHVNDNPLWPSLIYRDFSASSGTAMLLKDVVEVIDTGGVKNSSLFSVPLTTLEFGSI